MKKNKKNFLKKIFCSAFLLFLPFSAGAAIGLSPPEVNAPSVFRDIEQEFSMRLSRSGSTDLPLTIDVTKRGEFANYVEGPSQVVMAVGENSVDYEFKIVPTDAANGDYEVILSFLVGASDSVGGSSGGNSVKVVTGVSGIVRFTVSGEELVAYELSNLLGKDTEIGQPLFLSLNIRNKGNVDWRPEKIYVTFTDINDPTNMVSETFPGDGISIIKPGSDSTNVDLELASKLIEGSYKATAEIYYNGEIVETLESAKFAVYPSGTLAQKGELLNVETNKEKYELGEKVKLDALFKNTGKIQVKGVLTTEIYKGEDYLDLVRGEETYVDIGDESAMSLIIDLDESGDYKLTTSVKYGNKKTNTVDTFISVGTGVGAEAGVGSALGFLNSWIGIGLLVLILVIIVVVVKILKKKKTQVASVTTDSPFGFDESVGAEDQAIIPTEDSSEPKL